MKNVFSPAKLHGGTSKILLLVICAAIIIGLLLFFFGENLLKPVSKKEGPEKLPDQIEIIEQGDKKIVRNKAEGYQVTVPKEWRTKSKTTDRMVLEIPITQASSEIESAGIIINTYIADNQSLDEWISQKISQTDDPECFEINKDIVVDSFVLKPVVDRCQYGSPLIEYYLKSGSKIYSFLDDMAGEDKIKIILQSIKF